MAGRCRSFREMCRQRVANFMDRFDQSVAEFFVLKMFAHSFNESLPQFFATLLMDRLVSDDCEFVRARGDENQNVVALRIFVKPEPAKSFLRRNHGIVFQFTALNEYANFTGCFRLGVADRLHDRCVLKFTEKFSRSHWFTSLNRRPRRQNFRLRR